MSTPETWCIFDTETTGLISNDLRPLSRQPKVIEVAAVLIRPNDAGEWGEVGAFDTLVDPGCRIDDVITKVTGIKNEDLRGKPKWSDIALEFAQFIERADVIAAHNCSFDLRIVSMENSRIGRVTLWPERKICSVEQTEHLFGKRCKLSDLHTYLFGEPHANAHRALDDVRATSRCIVELIKRGEIN